MAIKTDYHNNKHHLRHHVIPERNEGLDIGLAGQRFSTGRFKSLIADTIDVITLTVTTIVSASITTLSAGAATITTSLGLSFLTGPGYLKIDSSEDVSVQATPIPLADGGTGATALAAGAVISNGTLLSTETLAVARGGTGVATLASGAYLKGAGAAAVTTQAVPIPVADGGTGQTSTAAYNATLDHGALLGLTDDDHTQYTRKDTLTTKGDIYAASAASTPARVQAGTDGYALTALASAGAGVAYTPIKSIIHLQDAGSINAVGTWYLASWAASATEVDYTKQIIPYNFRVTKIYALVGTAPGGSDTAIFTVRKNGADQAVTCTISAAGVSANDTAHSFTGSAGDIITCSLVLSATAASRTCSVAIQIESTD